MIKQLPQNAKLKIKMSPDADPVPIREFPLTDRSQELAEAFAARFNRKPDFFVRVPGRVNLIGEHIDYCGYGVCPMALEQDILLAVGEEADSKLRLYNIDGNYASFECDLDNFEISIGEGAPQWHQYFLCGVKGALEASQEGARRGMGVVVSGRVPQSAGLSSSSALVSSAALATAHVNKLAMSKERIAGLCADCERFIGTQGGGMDQAIAFLATEGCAKLIEFGPLRSKSVSLPQGAVFVIAHSLAKLNKAATADFNCRVVECRLAAQLMAKKLGLEWTNVKKLGDLQTKLAADLPTMIRSVEELLHEAAYTKAEIAQELETTEEALNDLSLTPNTGRIQRFKLRQRALHVFNEALRVELFHRACSSPSPSACKLTTLGRLMSESHASLRDLYECSHPQLDELVEASRDLAFGCRLTGAGWGGCMVALVPQEKLQLYLQTLREKFYSKHRVADLEAVLFTTAPQSGACIYVN